MKLSFEGLRNRHEIRFKDLESLLKNDDYYRFNKIILMSLLNVEEDDYDAQKDRLI
eukprot:CAMPEP_0170554130 /NCGR_PEP_ID=MMETSP0211-20121228/12014_1 /TAXON_ID=311385 /ORGANISM="Pseudokeronopsis sp., Strain OXSARD2" /LENGTH=55 /DNA_ID=CAMNT_0010863003 /DNA_START=1234 /DNA_END=1401 /DNA_ORIENTATION=+